jgi:PAS domain S-box-containing protein
MFPIEERAAAQAYLASLGPDNRVRTYEHRVILSNGQVVWQQWTDQSIFNQQDQLVEFQSVGRDVTERKSLEAKLHETAELLQAIIQGSPLGIVALDRQGKVLLWNPAMQPLFGWSAADVLGHPAPNIPAAQQAEFEIFFAAELRGENYLNLELQRLRKDGSLVEVSLWTIPLHNSGGEIVGVVGIVADISARKQTQAQLHYVAGLLDQVSDAIISSDLEGK